jgi:hypothetical protein
VICSHDAIEMIPNRQMPPWWKRITAVFVFLGAAAAGVAAFTGDLEKAADSVGKMMGWRPESVGTVSIRDGITDDFISSDDQKYHQWNFSFQAVVAKSGDQPLNNCRSQIKILMSLQPGGEVYSRIFAGYWGRGGKIFEINPRINIIDPDIPFAAGDHQELHSFYYGHLDLDSIKPDGHIQIRMLCDDVITQWFPLFRVTSNPATGSIEFTPE